MILILHLLLATVVHCAEPHAEGICYGVRQDQDECWPTAVKLPSNKVIYLPPRGRCHGYVSSNHSMHAEYSLPSPTKIDSDHDYFQSPDNNFGLDKLKKVLPQKYQTKFEEDEWTPQGAVCEVSTALTDHYSQKQKSNYMETPTEDAGATNFSTRRAKMMSRMTMPLQLECYSVAGVRPRLPMVRRPFQIPSGFDVGNIQSPYCDRSMFCNGMPVTDFAKSDSRIRQNHPGYGPISEYTVGGAPYGTSYNQTFHSPNTQPIGSYFQIQNEPRSSHGKTEKTDEHLRTEIAERAHLPFDEEPEHQSKVFLDSILSKVRAQKMSSRLSSYKAAQTDAHRFVENDDDSCKLRQNQSSEDEEYDFNPQSYSSNAAKYQAHPDDQDCQDYFSSTGNGISCQKNFGEHGDPPRFPNYKSPTWATLGRYSHISNNRPRTRNIPYQQTSPANVNIANENVCMGQQAICPTAEEYAGTFRSHQPLATNHLAPANPGGPVMIPCAAPAKPSLAFPIPTKSTASPGTFVMPDYSMAPHHQQPPRIIQNCFSPFLNMVPSTSMTSPGFSWLSPSASACPVSNFHVPLSTVKRSYFLPLSEFPHEVIVNLAYL